MSYYLTLCKYQVFHLYKLKATVFILVSETEQWSNADFFQLHKYIQYSTCKKSPFSAPWYLSKAVFLKWIVEPLNCLYQAAQDLAKNADFSVNMPLVQNL